MRKKIIPKGTLVFNKLNKQKAILINHVGSCATIYTHGGMGDLGDHEISVCRDQGEASTFVPLRFIMPYGQWICDDGTKILHNRDYHPIWSMSPDGKVESPAPETWVRYSKEEWFFEDGTEPWTTKETKIKCDKILNEFGVLGQLPKTMDLFEEIRSTGKSLNSIIDKRRACTLS
ncbi:MAG: hypothetical protein AB7U41_01090 [Dongiaceae bacterium]